MPMSRRRRRPPVVVVSVAVALLTTSAGLVAAPAAAAVKLAAPFVSHMVLQRGKPIPVWGTGDAGTTVTVVAGEQRASANVDAAGRWMATLDPLPVGGPISLTASAGTATATVDDVLVGDVFLCSGQSNMQFGLHELANGETLAANPPPTLRLGKVGLNAGPEPKDSFDLKWAPADAKTAHDFSALAYCFGRELVRQDPKLANVPIGLLEDCMGATVIESWMPKAALAKYDPKSLQMSMFGIGPSVLYNGMIAPLKTMPLAGVLWYQGEGNAGEPARYAEYLPEMMRAWRQQFAQPELPFLIVQLPDYAPDWGGVYWQWIRESEARAATATPHAGYVVSINTNDGWDLHPQGKAEIGRRMAALAREVVYHEPVPGRSPALKSAAVDGDAIRVTFDTDGSTLTAGTNAVDGFTLAGDDGVYHAATAVIAGPDAVVVRSGAVPAPKTVRYAWAGVPRATLYSVAGLPAAPFRTDAGPVEKGHGEAQPSPAGVAFKSPHYHLTIDGNGRATSLVVKYQQLLSNADGTNGGVNVVGPGGAYTLSKITPDGPAAVVCRNGEVSARVEMADAAVRWTVTNNMKKDAVRLTMTLAPSAEVGRDADGRVTVRRKQAMATVAGIDAVQRPKDPAADPGSQVLEVRVPAGETKAVELTVGR